MTVWNIVLDIVTIFSASYGSIMLKDYYDNRREKRSKTINNMDSDYERRKEVEPVLENIRHELDADRVVEYSFSNGDTTFGGYHMKKVTATIECYKSGLHEIASDFQLVPSANFKRNLDGLHFSGEDYYISHENDYTDDLAVLNKCYAFNTILFLKVRDKNGKWIGYITVSFADPRRELTREDIVYAKMQASRIII